MDAIQKIEQIEQDFEQRNPPFDDVTFPEQRLIEQVKVQAGSEDEPIHLSKEERLQLVSAFATFDYNRDANQLVDNLLELHQRKPSWFDPMAAPNGEKAFEYVFEEIGFRYPSRDGRAWCKNCRITRQKYSGKWSELLMEVGMDAPTLVEQLNEDDYNCLKGVKIAPMYARIINDEVAELHNIWELDIPLDVHLRRLSKDLFDAPDKSDDWLRREWRGVAVEADISRHVVDAALWQIGNNWSEWGEKYWNSL